MLFVPQTISPEPQAVMIEDASESREAKPAAGNGGDWRGSTIVVADAGKSIRVGSPFAVDPVLPKQPKKVEVLYDVGPLRYTAMGAVSASAMVVGFGLVAAFWFPSGGALIAALGCVLSIFGMYSNFRYVAAGLLVAHLGLFVVNYVQSLA